MVNILAHVDRNIISATFFAKSSYFSFDANDILDKYEMCLIEYLICHFKNYCC